MTHQFGSQSLGFSKSQKITSFHQATYYAYNPTGPESSSGSKTGEPGQKIHQYQPCSVDMCFHGFSRLPGISLANGFNNRFMVFEVIIKRGYGQGSEPMPGNAKTYLFNDPIHLFIAASFPKKPVKIPIKRDPSFDRVFVIPEYQFELIVHIGKLIDIGGIKMRGGPLHGFSLQEFKKRVEILNFLGGYLGNNRALVGHKNYKTFSLQLDKGFAYRSATALEFVGQQVFGNPFAGRDLAENDLMPRLPVNPFF